MSDGASTKLKVAAMLGPPPGVGFWTVICWVAAEAEVRFTMRLMESTKVVAFSDPFTRTLDDRVNPTPTTVTSTGCPAKPLPGFNSEILGAGNCTVKSAAFDAAPEFTTLIWCTEGSIFCPETVMASVFESMKFVLSRDAS